MTSHAESMDLDLCTFQQRSFSSEETTKTMYVAGAGPAVIVMPEMPGTSPDVVRFAGWVRDAGFTVYLPSLFGVDGAFPTVTEGGQILKKACVSKEFRAFADGGTSPIATWLRALARLAHRTASSPRTWSMKPVIRPSKREMRFWSS